MSSTLTASGWVVEPDVVDERKDLPRLSGAQIAAINARIAAGSKEFPVGTRVIRTDDGLVMSVQGVGAAAVFASVDVNLAGAVKTVELVASGGASLVGTADGSLADALSLRPKEDDILRDVASVWRYMTASMRADCLLATPVLDHSPAFQTAVDQAVESGVNKIFIPFARGQRYRFGSTVTILAGDFALIGDHAPIRGAAFGLLNSAGYIFGAAGVDALFDFGGSTNINFAGGFVCDGVSMYGRVNVESGNYGSQPRAIKLTQTNNGPTRNVLFRNVTANNFYDAFYFDNPGAGTLSAATVTFDACYTRNNANSAVYANKRILGLRYVGMLSESGGQLKGQIHGGVTITDNMLEGTRDNIDITGTGPASLLLQNNYFEANTGNFVCRFMPANVGSSVTLGENFFGGGADLDDHDDFLYVGGGATVLETRTSAINKWSLLTLESAWQGSKLKGKFFYPVESGKSATIWTDPRDHIGSKPASATTVRVVGFEAVDTPFGKTNNGLTHTGTGSSSVGPAQPLVYAEGDVIVVTALIKADEGSMPRMTVYDQSSSILPAPGGAMTTAGIGITQNMGGLWQLWCFVFVAARAGTGIRCSFGAGVAAKSIAVAGYGYQALPAADWYTTQYSAKSRAKCELWTPFTSAPAEIDYSATFNWPALAAASQQTTSVTMTGAAIGDYAEASMSVALSGTRLWAEVTAADAVTVYQRNDTAGSVDVASGSLKVRVRKQA